MAIKHVVYFTAGVSATDEEVINITRLNAVTIPQYKITVMNAAANTTYGEKDRLVPCDFVAGAIPTIYKSKKEINPNKIPNQSLSVKEVVVADGRKITGVTGTGTVATLTVNPTTKAITIKLSAT